MKNDNDILSKLGNNDGMKVPDGYFAEFTARMIQNLPEQEFEQPQEKIMPRSQWQRVRPYVYLAAMFMGIWCMMKMFDLMKPGDTDVSFDNNPTLISAISDDTFLEDFYNEESISDYDLFNDIYEQGVDADELTSLVTYK